jgi:UDP-N-acetylmuramyl pentapeptide phosphotransferase/UDP-N-acetylglucosamine-1-phosphate transferase
MSAQIVLILIFLNITFFFYFDEIVKKLKLYDYPDKVRKFHKKPVPMLGGGIFFLSFTIIFLVKIFLCG